MAELVVGSGAAAESAQMVTGAEERRTRDAAIRAAFADPSQKHHEAVAEAGNSTLYYAASPIVMGGRNKTIWPWAAAA